MTPADDPIIILIPVFNDWTATGLLLQALDRELLRHQLQVRIVLVDDASTEPPPPDFLQGNPSTAPSRAELGNDSAGELAVAPTATLARAAFQSFTAVEILELRRNLGHQRAIAIGLSYLHANERCPAILIMDGDGEDDPRDVPRLIEAFRQHEGRKIVFARRTERSESLTFRFCYSGYRVLHQLLTGQGINVGNFSILPFESVDRLVAVTELWNHYPSAVFKARLPFDTISTRRAVRLAGQPRMNFVGLVIHGLSAIAAYGDVVGVRLLLGSLAVIFLALVGLLTVVLVRFTTDLAIPGWATNAFGLLLIILFQAIASSIMFIFIILSNRQGANFLPVRDYSYFVLKTRRIACQP